MNNEKTLVIKVNEFRQNQKRYFDEITERIILSLYNDQKDITLL